MNMGWTLQEIDERWLVKIKVNWLFGSGKVVGWCYDPISGLNEMNGEIFDWNEKIKNFFIVEKAWNVVTTGYESVTWSWRI